MDIQIWSYFLNQNRIPLVFCRWGSWLLWRVTSIWKLHPEPMYPCKTTHAKKLVRFSEEETNSRIHLQGRVKVTLFTHAVVTSVSQVWSNSASSVLELRAHSQPTVKGGQPPCQISHTTALFVHRLQLQFSANITQVHKRTTISSPFKMGTNSLLWKCDYCISYSGPN